MVQIDVSTMGATDLVHSADQDVTQSSASGQPTRSANYQHNNTTPLSPNLVSSNYATPLESPSGMPSPSAEEDVVSSSDSDSEKDLDTHGNHAVMDRRLAENNVFAN